jgi:hypothetical protein
VILAIEAGLSIEVFWRLTWREFLLYRKGYEAKQLAEWQRTRMIAYIIYCTNTESGKRKEIGEFLPLSTDEQPDRGERLTQEQFIENMKKLSQAI